MKQKKKVAKDSFGMIILFIFLSFLARSIQWEAHIHAIANEAIDT